MHKNGQILTINDQQYRIIDRKNHSVCTECDLRYATRSCLDRRPHMTCIKTIPYYSVLKRINNVKSK